MFVLFFLSAMSEVLAKSGARVGLVGRDRARLDQVGFSESEMQCNYLPGFPTNCRPGRASSRDTGIPVTRVSDVLNGGSLYLTSPLAHMLLLW